MRKPTSTNTTSGRLNDDALRAIFEHLALPSLKAASLASKHFCKLVTPLLFASFNLTTHSNEDLDEVRQTVLKGNKARLSHHRFKVLSCEISELGDDEDLDQDASESGGESAFDATVAAYLRFLAAVNSVETLALTVTLSSEPPSDSTLLPAVGRLGQLASRKADKVKLELLFDGLEDDDVQESYADGNSWRFEQVLRTVPASLVSSLHMTGVNGASIKTAQAIGELLDSFANLTTLELTQCLVNMKAWKPSSLQVFSLSCIGEGSMQKCLPAAYTIIHSSSQSLERVVLHNTQGCRLQTKMPATPLQLPQLQHLELADRDINKSSLFALLLPSIRAPELRYLDLDLVDIFTPDLSAVVSTIPTLKGLHLGQGLLRCDSETTAIPANPGFNATKLACMKAGVDLRITYTSELCQTTQGVTEEMTRVGILANNLVTLSLGLNTHAAPAFEGVNRLYLPNLSHLFIALVPSDADDDTTLADTKPDVLARALSNIDAPLLRSLKLSISTGDKIEHLRAVIATLTRGHFSKLSVIGDEMLQDQLQATPDHESSIQSAILEVSPDATSLRFINILDDQHDDDFTDQETVVDSEEDAVEASLGKLTL